MLATAATAAAAAAGAAKRRPLLLVGPLEASDINTLLQQQQLQQPLAATLTHAGKGLRLLHGRAQLLKVAQIHRNC